MTTPRIFSSAQFILYQRTEVGHSVIEVQRHLIMEKSNQVSQCWMADIMFQQYKKPIILIVCLGTTFLLNCYSWDGLMSLFPVKLAFHQKSGARHIYTLATYTRVILSTVRHKKISYVYCKKSCTPNYLRKPALETSE